MHAANGAKGGRYSSNLDNDGGGFLWLLLPTTVVAGTTDTHR